MATSHTLTAYRNTGTGKLQGTFDPSLYYEITGAGFGTKTSIPYYEDFETQPLGPVPSVIGDLTISNTVDKYIGTNSHSGARAIECDYTGGTSAPGRFPKAFITLPERSNKVYFCCWFRFSGTTTDGSNVWKFLRFSNTVGSDPYGDTNKFSHEMTSTSGVANPVSHSESIFVDGALTTTAVNQLPADDTPANLFPNGQWRFYEAYIDAGTVGNMDANIIVKSNNKIALNFANRNFLSVANPQGIKYVLTPMNGIDDFTTSTLASQMDEVYSDGSLARCIMTDNSTYSLSTNWCVQPLAYLADTSALIIRKRGSFTVGVTAYLHLFGADGLLKITEPVVVE